MVLPRRQGSSSLHGQHEAGLVGDALVSDIERCAVVYQDVDDGQVDGKVNAVVAVDRLQIACPWS